MASRRGDTQSYNRWRLRQPQIVSLLEVEIDGVGSVSGEWVATWAVAASARMESALEACMPGARWERGAPLTGICTALIKQCELGVTTNSK